MKKTAVVFISFLIFIFFVSCENSTSSNKDEVGDKKEVTDDFVDEIEDFVEEPDLEETPDNEFNIDDPGYIYG